MFTSLILTPLCVASAARQPRHAGSGRPHAERSGAIAIDGAEPGDVLDVRIQSIALVVPYSTVSFRPTAGFLPEEFPHSKSKLVRLDPKRGVAHFAIGSRSPGQGCSSRYSWWARSSRSATATPPSETRSVYYGARNIPYGHIAVHRSKGHASELAARRDTTHYIAMGMHKDLTEATRIAVREAIDFLAGEKHLSRDDAYMLASVGVDFAITQLVDGNKGVHAMIPKSLFTTGPRSAGH
jgi:acetamidase/formamidase